jgi:membrane-bound lytic murein transglycosylase D
MLAVYVSQPKSIYIENPLNGNEADDDKPLITDSEKKDIDKEVAEEEGNTPTIEKDVLPHPAKYLYHTVAPGDTLFNIAKRYEGTSVEEIKTLNKIQDGRYLKPGTRLKVKVKT